jgi:glycosyltransferase involved in cell wall biosynthesis
VPRFVVLGRDFNFADMARQAENDESPRHILGDVCDRLGATVVSPSTCAEPSFVWRLLFGFASRFYSNAGVWSIAHDVARRVKTGELVYATGEDLGFTIAFLTALRRKKPALVVSVVWPERVKATKLMLAMKRRVRSFVVITHDKARQLRDLAGRRCPPILVLPAVVDLNFFSPVTAAHHQDPPLVISAGLVDRDYVTLAEAVEHIPVLVDVCAMSSMPAELASPAYPKRLPANMTIGSQSLKELRDMYRAACLTVVPLIADNHGSGLTVVWEAMACGCPVVATATAGDLAEYAAKGLIIGVAPENPSAMHETIEAALADPSKLSAMADQARAFVSEHFNDARYVDILTKNLVAAEF